MMQCDQPHDFVIATGQTHPLSAFVAEAFAACGLDWREHVDSNPALMRPTELKRSQANPRRSQELLGWQATTCMAQVAARMVEAERARRSSAALPCDHARP